MNRTFVALGLMAIVASAPFARSFDKEDIKDATEGACNWLIEQYDTSTKVFGKDAQAKEIKQVAMVLAALSDSPNDYKETNAPFISDPTKFLAACTKEEISKGDKADNDALKWAGMALMSLNPKKYNDLIEAIGKTQPLIKWDTKAVLAQAFADMADVKAERDYLAKAYLNLLVVQKSTLDGEADMNGKKVPWAATFAEKITKLQKEDGSFSNDVRANALALQILDVCYKSMK